MQMLKFRLVLQLSAFYDHDSFSHFSIYSSFVNVCFAKFCVLVFVEFGEILRFAVTFIVLFFHLFSLAFECVFDA